MTTYKNAVCRGSIWLNTGCGHCERCAAEIAERRYKQEAAEKADTFVATEISSQAATSPNLTGHVQGLPVAGYAKNVEQWKVDMVNANKILEEKVLRRVDEHVRPRGDDSIDGASV